MIHHGDCFAGSGSTGVACAAEGFGFLGIERDARYCAIARARIAHAAGYEPTPAPAPKAAPAAEPRQLGLFGWLP